MEVNFNTFPTIVTREDPPQEDGNRTPIVNLPTPPSPNRLLDPSGSSQDVVMDTDTDLPLNVSTTTEEAQAEDEDEDSAVPLPIVSLPPYQHEP